MGARFIGCDRDQVFLMPPSVRDWVPEGHLVWTVLDAVAELDLSRVDADYRDDGRGRPAYNAVDDGRAVALRVRAGQSLVARDRARLRR
jgi:transposase